MHAFTNAAIFEVQYDYLKHNKNKCVSDLKTLGREGTHSYCYFFL